MENLKNVLSHSVVSDSVRPQRWPPTRLPRPWDSPGKSAGVGCHFLLQGISPAQGLNLGLPHCRRILYHLSHGEAPRTLEWFANLFSQGGAVL